jgi:uncharacterized protein (DUF2267 family)
MRMEQLGKAGRMGGSLGAPFEAAADDFFRVISESGALPEGVDAREAAKAVVCTLLARLDLEQAREVLDALPAGVTEAIASCPIHGGQAGENLDARALLVRVGEHFQLSPDAVEPMTAVVLTALRAVLPPRPADVLARALPAGLRALRRSR